MYRWLSFALYISVLISLCTAGEGVGWCAVRRYEVNTLRTTPPPPWLGPLEGVGREIRDIFGPWNGNERVPVFIWRLAVLILMGADPLLGPSDSTFLGLKWNSLRSLPFQGQKKSTFSGPTSFNGHWGFHSNTALYFSTRQKWFFIIPLLGHSKQQTFVKRCRRRR